MSDKHRRTIVLMITMAVVIQAIAAGVLLWILLGG